MRVYVGVTASIFDAVQLQLGGFFIGYDVFFLLFSFCCVILGYNSSKGGGATNENVLRRKDG